MIYLYRYFNQAIAALFNFFFIYVIYRINISSDEIIFLLIFLGYGPVFSFVDLLSSRLTFAKLLKADDPKKHLDFFFTNIILGILLFTLFLVFLLFFIPQSNIKTILIILYFCFIFFGITQGMRLVFNHFQEKVKYEVLEAFGRIASTISIFLIYIDAQIFSFVILGVYFCYFLFSTFKIFPDYKIDISFFLVSLYKLKRTQVFIFSFLEIFIHYLFFITLVNFLDIDNKDEVLVWFRVLLGFATIMRIPIDLQVSVLTKTFIEKNLFKI